MALRRDPRFDVMEQVISIMSQNRHYLNDLMSATYAYKLATRGTIHRDDMLAFLKAWWLSKALSVTTSSELALLDSAVEGAADLLTLFPVYCLRIVKHEGGFVVSDKKVTKLHTAMHSTNLTDLMLELRDVYDSKQDRKLFSSKGVTIYSTFYSPN